MTRGRHLLFAVPLGAVAGIALWLGDARLTHRDWLTGATLFGLGLAVTFLFIRELRRGGLVR